MFRYCVAVRVEAAQQETRNQRQVVTKNSGLMGAQKAASQTQDSRMKALAANNAYSEVMKDPAMMGGVNISLSVGSSRSQSQSTQSSETARGAQVQAGKNISIQAQDAQILPTDLAHLAVGLNTPWMSSP